CRHRQLEIDDVKKRGILLLVGMAALMGASIWQRVFLTCRVDVRPSAARAQINSFMRALHDYKLDTGGFPTAELGLKALCEKPHGVNNWQGPYLSRTIPNDPWGNRYVYKFPGDHGNEPDVISLGADRQPGGYGANQDVVSWKSTQ